MKDWMYVYYKQVLKFIEKWLEDLKKVLMCVDVENCLNFFCDINLFDVFLKEFMFFDFEYENVILKWCIFMRDKQVYLC